MANTTNFGWETPDDTDLVKDGAAAMRTLGSAIDTSMMDLKGGTSGQILSKNSNTDMDFVWIANDQGDITGVTASAPLTGGGTSGAITVGIQDGTTAQKGAVQLTDSTSSTSTTTAATPNSVKSAYDLADAAIAKSLVDAKGDLLVGSADNTVARLAVGTDNYVLTADSSATNGIKWAAAAGGGKVLQVVSATYSTETTIASTTYTDTGLTATITPSATTSKILVMVGQQLSAIRSNQESGGALQLLRGATAIHADGSFQSNYFYYSGNTTNTQQISLRVPIVYLDSPSTTSATTYKTQGKAYATSSSGSIKLQDGNVISTITLLEIGA